MLMIMAGVLPSPHERALQRAERRMQRLNRVGQQEIMLLDQIARRERGQEGEKPMPFARQDEE